MAYGTPLQELTAFDDGAVTTLSVTVTEPSADSMCVHAGIVFWDAANRDLDITTPASKYTQQELAQDNLYGSLNTFPATGSGHGTTVTQTSGTSDEQTMMWHEWDGLDTTTPLDATNLDVASIGSADLDQESGAATNTVDNALCIAHILGEKGATSPSLTYTNSFVIETEVITGPAAGGAWMSMATKQVTSQASQETLAEWSTPTNKAWGFITILRKAIVGGPNPLIALLHQRRFPAVP